MQNRPIDPNLGPLSLSAFYKGNDSLQVLLAYLEKLPYQRISDPENLSLTIFEHCGTCSSKHAFLKLIAEEQGWEDFELILCMYKMNEENTPGIGPGLLEAGLSYIPEAHCYIKVGKEKIDITRPGASMVRIANMVLSEAPIGAEQIGEWKKNFHRSYIEEWINSEKLKFDLEEVWKIRENCIKGIVERQSVVG